MLATGCAAFAACFLAVLALAELLTRRPLSSPL